MAINRFYPHKSLSRQAYGEYVPKKKVPKRQQESLDQRAYVKALNSLNIGFFYRVKSMGTFDHIRKVYRKNSELVSVPDIVGFINHGPAVYIEVKRVINVEKKKKLVFKAKISDSQKEFLLRAYRAAHRSGIAFSVQDAIAIATDDAKRYPRHPRTLLFLPEQEVLAYAEEYKKLKHEHAEVNADPLRRLLEHQLPDKE